MRFKIDWASLTVGRKFAVFAFFYFVFEVNFQVQVPRGLTFGGAIWRRDFCVMNSVAYIWRGLYMEGLIFGILRYVGERSQKLVGGNSHKKLGETEQI